MVSEGRIRVLLQGAIEEALKVLTQLLRNENAEVRLQAATSILETWVQFHIGSEQPDGEDWQEGLEDDDE